MLGRVVTFMGGGWLLMSAFAWPRSDYDCINTWVGGALTIAYGLAAIFFPAARYLVTVNAALVGLVSLVLDGGSSAGCANNMMVAAVLFGASLLPPPRDDPAAGAAYYGASAACAVSASKASMTGWPCRPGGDG